MEDLKNCTDPSFNYKCSKCIPDNTDICHEGEDPFFALFHYCSLNDIFGMLGLLLNILFYISPIFDVHYITKNPIEINNFPKFFILLNLINATVQVGIIIHAIQYLPYIFITNILGIMINFIYLGIFLYLLMRSELKKVIIYMFATVVGLSSIIIFFYYLPFFVSFNCKEKTFQPDVIHDIRFAIIVMIINTFMLIAPIQNLGKAIRNKNTKIISLGVFLISLLLCISNLIYGILENAYLIYIPYGFGVLLYTFSLGVYLSIRKQMRRFEENSLLKKLNIESPSGLDIN